jgi:pimeloyl-ACP methyl ester carboxylesterase
MLAGAVPDPMLRAFLLQNLVIEEGRARWRINLDALGRNMEALLGFPSGLPEPAYEGPAFFLHGGASPYVPPETHPRIRALFPAAGIEALPGAGHFLHAEQPEAFLGKVEGWLGRL